MSHTYRWEITRRIVARRVMAIVRSDSAAEAEEISDALLLAGLDVLEVSLTTPGALGAIERLAARHPGALIGAGTVLDAPTARSAVLAGARFLVAPSFCEEVLRTGHRYGAVVAPGCQTPTEIEAAVSAGADLVKLFPAGQFGPGYVSAVRAALPQAPIMATGGVGAANAREWLDAGAVALGVGGALTRDAASAGARAAELLAAIGD
ncbi:MAG: 2-dehydro-3-deoxyphosphogluconate aldolase/4-hydroxy-2-oxoglutarate aldolase [Conexibacter sp.]|nr:2-dehydro-3-deoxyphosphogluconate aldolase/4-hydroxy-2-oxoglutarate aldolase [Conexibacter sp.]